jgi:hypothetical protein
MHHLERDDCERYALNQLIDDALRLHEEHLLICEKCQTLQAAEDEYVGLMKQALSAQPPECR